MSFYVFDDAFDAFLLWQIVCFFIHNGFGLQKHFGLAIQSKRPVVRCVCIARNGDSADVILYQLLLDPVAEPYELVQVCRIGPARRKNL